MMTDYTSKLFFGKYPYKVVFSRKARVGDPSYHSGWTVHNCRSWLLDQKIEHRIYTQINYCGLKNDPSTEIVVKASLFLESKADFDACMLKWGSVAIRSTVPYDRRHVDMLKDNSRVQIRNRLIYGRYRYVVVFRRRWGEDVSDILAWIKNNISMLENSKDSKVSFSGWNPRLYLANEDDFVLTKLAMGDRIKEVVVIRTREEL